MKEFRQVRPLLSVGCKMAQRRLTTLGFQGPGKSFAESDCGAYGARAVILLIFVLGSGVPPSAHGMRGASSILSRLFSCVQLPEDGGLKSASAAGKRAREASCLPGAAHEPSKDQRLRQERIEHWPEELKKAAHQVWTTGDAIHQTRDTHGIGSEQYESALRAHLQAKTSFSKALMKPENIRHLHDPTKK
jgi:hypothetical protein